MAITTRSEYGLRAMSLLAEQLGDELLSASEIARREDIPVKYLEQILSAVRKAGLVRSQPGARGGYRLARPAREITVREVVVAVDGPVSPLACSAKERASTPGYSGTNRLRPLWDRLELAMRDVLEHTTLDQLAFSPCLSAPPATERPEKPAPVAPDGTVPPSYVI